MLHKAYLFLIKQMSDLSPEEYLVRITIMPVFALFALGNIVSLTIQFKISTVIQLIFYASLVFIYLIRSQSERISSSMTSNLIAVSGSVVGFLFLSDPKQQEIFIFQVIGIIGFFISLAGLWSLNKSFGVIAADRGIVTDGMYCFVRHPLYLGYLLTFSCFLIQNYTLWNLGVFISFLLLMTARLLHEEKLLEQNPEYVQYTKKVRWRILPYIW